MVSWEKIQGRFQGVWWSHINNGNYILLEYSGVKDKNRTEIYQGDYVKLSDTNPVIFIVEKVLTKYGYKFIFVYADTKKEVKNCFLDNCEVVGNIYKGLDLKLA